MPAPATVSVGDTVNWRGCFGADAPRSARILGIEHTRGGKYGTEVQSAPVADFVGREYVVTLDNGHWAYAEQIEVR